MASVSGRSRKTRSICSSTSAVRIESASVGRLVGRERRVGVVRAERRVQLADHDAERLERGPAAPPGSLASSSSASSQPSREPSQELLQDAERRVEQAPLDLVPAGQRGDVREAVGGQEAQQLELRVHARLDLAERLHDQLVAEDDRGVGLLDADRAHVDGAAEAGARAFGAQRKMNSSWPTWNSLLERIAVQQLAARGRVGERVVDGPAVGLEDHALGPALAGRAQAERHLVGLVRPGREARLDQAQHEQRRLARAA